MINRIETIVKWTAIIVVTSIACMVLYIVGCFVYYTWFTQEWSPARIERITEIRVPNYEIIECKEGRRSFTRDYMDTCVIEFKTMPSDEMFEEIEKRIKAGNSSGWKKEGNKNSFSAIWGNGFPAPKGESENDDRIFGITMTRGERMGEIYSGWW